jgi:hypothetical protein
MMENVANSNADTIIVDMDGTLSGSRAPVIFIHTSKNDSTTLYRAIGIQLCRRLWEQWGRPEFTVLTGSRPMSIFERFTRHQTSLSQSKADLSEDTVHPLHTLNATLESPKPV